MGLSGLAAGFAIGIVGDAGVRGTAQQPRLFVGMILILIFAEVSSNLKLPLWVMYCNLLLGNLVVLLNYKIIDILDIKSAILFMNFKDSAD